MKSSSNKQRKKILPFTTNKNNWKILFSNNSNHIFAEIVKIRLTSIIMLL